MYITIYNYNYYKLYHILLPQTLYQNPVQWHLVCILHHHYVYLISKKNMEKYICDDYH